MIRILCLLVFSLAFTSLSWGQRQLTGELDGVGYIIDVPEHPSGKVMFLARGFRPDFFPVSAVYEVGTRFYQTMLSEGWTIASTAFRTNDWVVEEGAEDILALRAFIDADVHRIEQAILYGETMGGGVAVWIAENRPEGFDGVLCLGAHLFPEPGTADKYAKSIASVFSGKPRLPMVLLANGEEMESSEAYAAVARTASDPPITWYVERTGHVNVNSAERLAAMRGLFRLMEEEQVESVKDGTIHMSPASTAARSKTVAATTIRLLRPLYGNIYTHLVPEDLKALDIQLSDRFILSHKEQAHSITYAKAYSDVPYGEWVAFIDPEGFIQISRNYANAAETLGAEIGDPLLILKSE